MEELLKEYKRISDKILYEIMKDDLESAENSMKVRQDILNKLLELSINKNIDIEKNFGILTLHLYIRFIFILLYSFLSFLFIT